MNKSYKFRIYPNKEQELLIQKIFGCTRFVYNHYLGESIKAYKENKEHFNWMSCSNNLTQLKKELEWLKEADCQALQQSLRHLDKSYKNFFRRLKTNEKSGFPKFKSKKNNKKSYRTCDRCIRTEEDKFIVLPKLKKIKAKISTEVKGRIVSATVSQTPSGKYFVSLCCDGVEMDKFAQTGKQIGIDLGLKHLLITSDNNKYTNHKFFTKSQKKLARLQRQLSRKTIGSNNRNKARKKVAILHEKICNQRNDNLHKITTDLVKQNDLICVESLKIKNMVKNRKLAKVISDASWGELVRMLEYKCEWYGKHIVHIDSFFASSQICSNCGEQSDITKDLSVREWKCPHCDTLHDRDLNASKNILNEGIRLIS